MPSMRERLLEEGMRLFGERGYTRTSVADIQLACGLTGGSGALYKHFSSKEALLVECVHGYVAALEKSASGLIEVLPDDPAQALRAIGEAVIAAMASDRSMIRIGLRDLEAFPDLLQVLWQGLMSALYRELARWLEAQRDVGRVSVVDPAATAAVLVASLTYYRVLEALIGHTPGDVEDTAYLSAWVDTAVASVQPIEGGAR